MSTYPDDYIFVNKSISEALRGKGLKSLSKWRLVMDEKTIRWRADKKKLSNSLKYRWLQKYVYVPKDFTKKQVEKFFNKARKLKKHQIL